MTIHPQQQRVRFYGDKVGTWGSISDSTAPPPSLIPVFRPVWWRRRTWAAVVPRTGRGAVIPPPGWGIMTDLLPHSAQSGYLTSQRGGRGSGGGTWAPTYTPTRITCSLLVTETTDINRKSLVYGSLVKIHWPRLKPGRRDTLKTTTVKSRRCNLSGKIE